MMITVIIAYLIGAFCYALNNLGWETYWYKRETQEDRKSISRLVLQVLFDVLLFPISSAIKYFRDERAREE